MKKIIFLLCLFPVICLAAEPQMDQVRDLVRKRNWPAVISQIQNGGIEISEGEKPIWDFLYGYALEESGRFQESMEPLSKAAAANSVISDYAWFYLGMNSIKLGDADQAEASLKKIQSRSYIYTPARLALAKIYLESGKPDQAGAELGMIKDKKLRERLAPEKLLLEARLDRALAKTDSADQKFRQFLINYPLYKPGPRPEETPLLSAEENLQRCRKLLSLGAVKQAGKELEALLSETGQCDRKTLSQAMGALAEARFRARDYKGVIALEPSAEQYAKSNAQFWFYMAWSYQRLGKDELSVKYYLKCVDEFDSSEYSAHALYNLARMEQEKQRVKSAQQYYELLLNSYPESEFSKEAGFQLGLFAYEEKDFGKAIQAFNSGLQFGTEVDRFKYWLAKSYQGYGYPEKAGQLRQEILRLSPGSVYSFMLDPCPTPKTLNISRYQVSPASVTSNFKAGLLLAWLGLNGLAEAELSWQIDNQPTYKRDLVYLMEQLEEFQAYPLAFIYFRDALVPRLKPGEITSFYEYIYPLAFSDLILPVAKKYGIEPAFAYALIKQESAFNPGVSSPVGAMGLTQVMPPLARKQAKALGYGKLDHDDYFDPEINLELGFSHLAELLQRYEGAGAYPWQMILIGCAYNAGMGRADKWFLSASQKGTDPDIFIERIPFSETRDYVKKVFAGLRIYRARIENNPARCP